jgi:hypothetical protein
MTPKLRPAALPPSSDGSLRDPRAAERGVATVWVAVFLPAFLMLVWMGVEIGNAARAANRASAAADAVALAAAARHVDGRPAATTTAVAAAAAAGGVQIVVAPGGDLEFGVWDAASRMFTPDPVRGRAVRATVRFAQGHPNGPIDGVLGTLGPGLFDVARQSVAVYCPPRDRTSLLLLGATTPQFDLDNDARLVADGVLAVADDGDGLRASSASTVRAPAIALAGLLGDASFGDGFDADIDESSVVPTDPYAAMALPVGGAATAIPTLGGVVSVAPGTHDGLVAADGEYVLAPGDHVFAASIALSGTAVLRLDGARIVLRPGCSLGVSDGASIVGSARPATEDAARAWLAARSDTVGVAISGDAQIDVDGIAYAPQTRAIVTGAARCRMTGAILATLSVRDTAEATLTGGVAALEQPLAPGRARLVR